MEVDSAVTATNLFHFVAFAPDSIVPSLQLPLFCFELPLIAEIDSVALVLCSQLGLAAFPLSHFSPSFQLRDFSGVEQMPVAQVRLLGLVLRSPMGLDGLQLQSALVVELPRGVIARQKLGLLTESEALELV